MDATAPAAAGVNRRSERPGEQEALRQVAELLARQRRVEVLVQRQTRDGSRHRLVEGLVHQQHLAELSHKLDALPVATLAGLIEALPSEDSLLVWELVARERGGEILARLPAALRATLGRSTAGTRPLAAPARPIALHVFELAADRWRHVEVASKAALAATRPIWVDMLAPTAEERAWVEAVFGLRLPAVGGVTNLEESARFYIDDDGSVRLHSDFLLAGEPAPRNVAVAFVLHRNILFSLREEELPVFRLQRLLARLQSGLPGKGIDALLDLYGTDIEYSADALEAVYGQLESVGGTVLASRLGDDEAAAILAATTRQEDLNGRIRRNARETRRALSFLMRRRLLQDGQRDNALQILRDIDSLDGHTAFLFGKISFLLDATVGFINITQNKRVSRLTTVGVIFTPINIIAGIGGMSEFSMMSAGMPWPLAYGGFVAAMVLLGFSMYYALHWLERRTGRKSEG